MGRTFDINIMTGHAVAYSGKISSLIVPSANGYLGVLTDHAPLVSVLKAGKITLKDASGKAVLFDTKGEGFLHMVRNNATILYIRPDSVRPAAYL